MKKIVYIIAFAFVSSLAITSCTEEEVKPQSSTSGNGGTVLEDKP